jgi:hypothetical protein
MGTKDKQAQDRSMRTQFTIGNIRHELRTGAPYIASQYSALWSEMVGNLLTRIERKLGDRMSTQIFDEMHDYGMTQVRKHGLPARAEVK